MFVLIFWTYYVYSLFTPKSDYYKNRCRWSKIFRYVMIYISGDDLRMSPIVYWTIYEGKAFTQFYGPFHMDQAYIERAQ